MRLRRAKLDEVKLLNEMAYESEAIWGEDDDYMLRFSQDYKLTEDMIKDDLVYVLEKEGSLIGFFALLVGDDAYELELFYISKTYIRSGYGSLLWSKIIEVCESNHIKQFGLVASDDVVDFYKKHGAVEVERIKSTLKSGRIVTRLEYSL